MSESAQGKKEEGIRFGRYLILERIGRGGMAEVSRARILEGPRAGQEVALKRLLPELATNPQYVDLFCSEADLSRMLVHPNIVRVYEAGACEDTYYIAMERIDGRDLGQILARCRERKILLPVDFALFLIHELLQALAAAHTATSPTGKFLNVVHCDVSPSNLFISKMGEVKLGDFGIAKVWALDPSRRKGLWGKVHYASPELLRGETVLPQVDIWAAGVMLYELLTLCRPFTGRKVEDIAREIVRADPIPICDLRPEVPEAVERVVSMALHPNPARRFADAAAFAGAIRPLFDDQIGTPLAIASVVRGLFST
ncbi:MAG: serine/threonine-protein kinase [Pseudomonadota bacterium]|nr:MAG: serine/threonine protein kinase [Pseudomonadota bacterium]